MAELVACRSLSRLDASVPIEYFVVLPVICDLTPSRGAAVFGSGASLRIPSAYPGGHSKGAGASRIEEPVKSRKVTDGLCQEVVLTKKFDVWDVVPMISHTRSDPERTLGAGTTLVPGRYSWDGSHLDQVATHWYRKESIPVTVTIGIPPACTMNA